MMLRRRQRIDDSDDDNDGGGDDDDDPPWKLIMYLAYGYVFIIVLPCILTRYDDNHHNLISSFIFFLTFF